MKRPVVLVVEDNAITRKVVRLALGSEGLVVVEATNASEAVHAVATKRPDLILQDLRLADIDGVELVGQLRALPDMSSVPIIAFSGFLSRLGGRAEACGFTDVVAKPIEPSRLVQVVLDHLPDIPARVHPHRTGRVLVVDDDPLQLKAVALRLQVLGFDVLTAVDGVTALEVLRTTSIDAVLSDVLMPRMDGFQLCAEIRRDQSLAQLPVVLASSNYIEPGDRALAEQMGASAFVLREPDLEAAIAELTLLLSRPRAPIDGVEPDPAAHHVRVARQLERQTAINAMSTQHSSVQASILSVVAGMSEVLSRHHTVDGSLPDVLASLLDASGVSRGALFLSTARHGELTLTTTLGFDDRIVEVLRRFGGHRVLFDEVIASKTPSAIRTTGTDPSASDLLARIDVDAAIMIPFVSGDDGLGIVLLASQSRDLSDHEWIAFGRMIAVQVGQALALARAFNLLSASERRNRTLIDRASECIVILDLEGRIEDVNPEGQRFLGASLGQLTGRSVFDLIEPGDRHQAKNDFIALVENGRIATHSTSFTRTDGTIVIADISATVVEIDGSRVVMSIWRDVTARQHALEALRASEARFVRLWESAVVGIVITDRAGNILDANDAYLTMVGYVRADLVAGDVRWLEEVPGSQSDVERDPQQREMACLHKDGRHVPVMIRVAMLDAERSIAIVADLTEQRRIEESLLKSNEQLRHSQKMEAVGALAGGIAHDFNNALAVVLSYGEMILADLPVGAPIRDDIEEICKAGRSAADLTRQLLMFSRQQVVEPKIVDLGQALRDVDRMLRRILGADIELVSLPADSLGTVWIDPGSLEQVIMNLVINARDAMPTGGKLTMETANVVLDDERAAELYGATIGPHVMLAITDTGTGMDALTQSHIFEPFYTTKPRGKGTGLGLSTVFAIVQQSGGAIWVNSVSGVGTRFEIYLPRVDGIAQGRRPTRPMVPSSSRGTETILIVEDDDQVRVVAGNILRRNGYTILEARSAAIAMQLLGDSTRVDLLLSDVVMPRMSGPALARQIASRRPDIKILCMSGHSDDKLEHVDARLAYLQKPFTPETLTRKVRDVLDGRVR